MTEKYKLNAYPSLFKSFKSIENIDRLDVYITQKIHGTNAQILIEEDLTLKDSHCESLNYDPTPYGIFSNATYINLDSTKKITGIGSRSRWLEYDDDNYGFCNFVLENENEFLKLPAGRYYGEWCVKGINSGEGLSDRKFVLFNPYLKLESLPPQTVLVPLLFEGKIRAADLNDVINDTFSSLKQNGSSLCPGFMEPEGIVISIDNKLYKKVFKHENKPIERIKTIKTDYDYLCQPMRLEKLLSRDQRYTYIENIVKTVKAYFEDLVKENEISGTEEEIQNIIKAASRQVFNFIKSLIG